LTYELSWVVGMSAVPIANFVIHLQDLIESMHKCHFQYFLISHITFITFTSL